MKKVFKFILYAVLLSFIAYVLLVIFIRPSTDRNWTLDQKIQPTIKINDKNISIENIRNFKYRSTSDYDTNYYNATYAKNSVRDVWFVVEPFDGPNAAHTFLSFGFDDGRYLSISVEIRKEIGESYHPVTGLFRKYELSYVIADERDVIGLRANHRKDRVYLYKASTTKEKANQLFEDMLTRANNLQKNPEFYNTLTNTCTTNLVSHINKITEGKVPFDLRVLFPENSDQLAYELGLLDVTGALEEIKGKYNINDLTEKYQDQEDFSVRIREKFLK